MPKDGYSLEKVVEKISKARALKKTIVLVTGVFDVLHKEHIIFLEKARNVGGYLVIGLESDKRVREMKGEGRPINNQTKRMRNVEKLHIENLVFILPQNFSKPKDHENLISILKPDILAVSTHTKHQKEKKKILEKYGGRVEVVHEHNPLYSSTLMIERKTT